MHTVVRMNTKKNMNIYEEMISGIIHNRHFCTECNFCVIVLDTLSLPVTINFKYKCKGYGTWVNNIILSDINPALSNKSSSSRVKDIFLLSNLISNGTT